EIPPSTLRPFFGNAPDIRRVPDRKAVSSTGRSIRTWRRRRVRRACREKHYLVHGFPIHRVTCAAWCSGSATGLSPCADYRNPLQAPILAPLREAEEKCT